MGEEGASGVWPGEGLEERCLAALAAGDVADLARRLPLPLDGRGRAAVVRFLPRLAFLLMRAGVRGLFPVLHCFAELEGIAEVLATPHAAWTRATAAALALHSPSTARERGREEAESADQRMARYEAADAGGRLAILGAELLLLIQLSEGEGETTDTQEKTQEEKATAAKGTAERERGREGGSGASRATAVASKGEGEQRGRGGRALGDVAAAKALFLARQRRARTHVAPVLCSGAVMLEALLPLLPLLMPFSLRRRPLDDFLDAMVLALELLPDAQAALVALMLNHPASIPRLTGTLIRQFALCPDLVEAVLVELATLSSSVALQVRGELVRQRKMSRLALRLTTEVLEDEVEFLSSVLYDCAWLKGALRRDSSEELRRRLLTRVEGLEAAARAGALQWEQLEEARALVRIYAAALNTSMRREEARAVLALLHALVPNAAGMGRLACCWCLTCEGLLRMVDRHALVECLRLLLASDCSELFLLIAIHFHTKNLTAIVELARAALGIHATIHNESLNLLGTVVTNDVFLEQDAAARALELPVTPLLSTGDWENLAVSCVYHLLSEGVFSKYSVDVGPWLYKQLRQCALPIHHLMPPLLEQFVNAVLEPLKQQQPGFQMRQFTAEEVTAVLEASDSSPAQMLMLFYVLTYSERLLGLKASEASNAVRTRSTLKLETVVSAMEYPAELLETLPVQRLSRELLAKEKEYENMYPPMFAMMLAQYPQYFLPEDLLAESTGLLETSCPVSLASFASPTEEDVRLALRQPMDRINATLILVRLEEMQGSEADALVPLATELLVPAMIRGETQEMEQVERRLGQLWLACSARGRSRQLTVQLANLLQPLEEQGRQHAQLSYTQLLNDPLLVLRADGRALDVPVLLELLLKALQGLLAASRLHLVNQAQASPEGSAKQEELHTLLYAQDSAVLQLLLESCLQGGGKAATGVEEEKRRLVCSFVHQQFIENPLLVKLVHFQTYSVELLPVLVAGVPSMHICLEFLQELMGQPQRSKQLFAIHLATCLAEQFPIPSCLFAARLSIAHMRATSASADGAAFLLEAVQCLPRLCAAFPVLCGEATQLLLLLQNAQAPPLPQAPALQASQSVRKDMRLQQAVYDAFARITDIATSQ